MRDALPLPSVAEVRRVVLIDDSADDRADVRRMLLTGSDRRYVLVEADTGAAGVRAVLSAAGGPTDCVLLDHDLPDMTVAEVLAALAGPGGLPVCPVVVLTGAAGADAGRAVLRTGAQECIGKGWLTAEGLTGTLENAAERWRMARELRAREERLTFAFEAADLAYFAWDVATDRVDRRLSRLPGLPSTEGVDRGPTSFAEVAAVIHPDDRGGFESTVRVALAGDGRYANKYRVSGSDSSPVWVEEHGRVLFDGDRPIQLVGVARDVTERQREAERRALLLDVARVVLEAPAADGALSGRVFDMIRGLLGLDFLFNYRLAGDGALQLVIEVGVPAERSAAAQRLELGQAFCGAAAAARESLVADYRRIATDPLGTFVRDLGVRAYACHPLLARNGGLLGTFSVGSATRDAFEPAEVEFLQTVSHFLALAWDRQRAEDALRRAEALTRDVTDVAPSILYVYDLDEKRNVWSNRETFALLGFTREQLDAMAGDLLGNLLHPDDQGPHAAYAERLLALADGEVAELEYRMRTADGSWRWLVSREMVFTRHADGRPGQIVGAALDITARKESEQAVRDREDRLRLALEASDTGLWTWDMRSDTVVWSPEVNAIHGLAPSMFAGTEAAFFALVHPDDRARVEAAVRAAIAAGDLYECEFRVLRPDGTVIWVANRGRASHDPAGAPLQVLGTVTDITRRKQVEEELARSERFARSVVESSADCVKGLSPDGKLLWMNENGKQLLEVCDFDRVKGCDWAAFWDPGGMRPEAEAALATARAGGVGRFRGFCPTTAGTPRWWDVAVTPIFGPDNTVEQLLSVSRDVTEARAAEQRLAESESFYRQTMESIPGMVFTCTPDGACDYLSGPWIAFTGVPLADQLGIGWVQVLHPDDRDRAFATWEAAVQGLGEYDLEYRIRRQDGAHEWFKVRGRAIRDASGAIVRWFGTAVNIDDLKQAEGALKARERELQTLADNSPDILTRFDRDLRHVFVNAAVERATGRPRAEFLGRTNRELGMPAELCDRWEAGLRAVFESGQHGSIEFSYETPAGRRHYAARYVPEFGPDGRTRCVLGVTHDVTDRHQFEQTLADQDRRKDEFLATLAHELRNPLAPLRNGLEVIRMAGEVSSAVARAREMMERQVGHLVHLVDDLLDISRVSRGTIPLRIESVTVREVVGAAIEACRPTVDAKRHALAVDLPAEPLAIDGDRTRLVQVVSNLLTNAAKYSEDRGRITVAARREGDDAVIEVTDTGVGIAPEMLLTVWDMFAQVSDTLDKAQGGLGIGLSLVKKLVEMHGGSVTAGSPGLGLGSTFTVRLPLAARAAAPASTATHATPAESPGRRVLVVDDNEDGAESLAMMLDILGHRAEVALTGPTALRAASAFRPEVVLCDIGLPGMDGYEVARRLRADPTTADAVLVALTGWGSQEDKQRSKRAGFDFHLTKPVEVDAIQKILARPTGGDPP